jgi:serine/threonine protein kinase
VKGTFRLWDTTNNNGWFDGQWSADTESPAAAGQATSGPPRLTVGAGDASQERVWGGDSSDLSPPMRVMATTAIPRTTTTVTVSIDKHYSHAYPLAEQALRLLSSATQAAGTNGQTDEMELYFIPKQGSDSGSGEVLSLTTLYIRAAQPKEDPILGKFDVALCANLTNRSGCFVQLNLEMSGVNTPAQDQIKTLVGLPDGNRSQLVELIAAIPKPNCVFCILGLSQLNSILLIGVVGAAVFIGLTTGGLKYRAQRQTDLKNGLGWGNDASQNVPFLANNRMANMTMNTKKGMQKVGLSEREAVEWLIDFTKLKIGAEVGQGASAQVFRGTYCGQTVAVKRLFPTHWEPQLEEFFKGEVRLLTLLHHPNIVRLYGAAYNQGDGRCYIVTEFCSEGSIATLIQMKSKAVARERFYDVALGICHGMGYLHSKPVVHRDLKPENVLLTAEFTVKLCDFGVSRMINRDDTAMTGQIGTPAYMAPEMIEGRRDVQGTTKVDIFSFAIVLWTLWTGLVPYTTLDLTPFSLLSKILGGLRPELPDDLPKELRKLIELCWSQDPQERLTFEELQKELEWMGMQQQEQLALLKADSSAEADAPTHVRAVSRSKVGNFFNRGSKSSNKKRQTTHTREDSYSSATDWNRDSMSSSQLSSQSQRGLMASSQRDSEGDNAVVIEAKETRENPMTGRSRKGKASEADEMETPPGSDCEGEEEEPEADGRGSSCGEGKSDHGKSDHGKKGTLSKADVQRLVNSGGMSGERQVSGERPMSVGSSINSDEEVVRIESIVERSLESNSPWGKRRVKENLKSQEKAKARKQTERNGRQEESQDSARVVGFTEPPSKTKDTTYTSFSRALARNRTSSGIDAESLAEMEDGGQ